MKFTMNKQPIIEFKNFTFQYHAQAEPTLKNISFTIYQGEKVVIIGASGSGKSTLMKCLNGIIPQIDTGEWSGEVSVGKQRLGEASVYDLSLEVGTILQDLDGQFVGMTVAEDIAFSLENDNMRQVDMKKAVQNWAERVDIQHLLKEKPQNLSGGQKQRVSIAGVLIDETPILLFDEPLASLDPAAGKDAMELIDELHRSGTVTTIVIEHRLEDVLHRKVDRMILMDEGQVIADSTPDALLTSDLLKKHGIREPLYIAALKEANVHMENVQNIANPHHLQGSDIREKLVQWQETIVEKEETLQSAPILEVKEVKFSYPHHAKQILKGIGFTINQSEMISIVGGNGAGKSTIAKLICGFEIPTSGEILWKGHSIGEQSIKEIAERVGYIMQNPNQMISQTKVFDEVALGLVKRGWSTERIQRKVEEILKICGLYPFRSWPIVTLSYGQKKRVTIAAILVLEPDLLILDEPTAGQDFRHYTEIMNFIKELNQLGETIVIITHDMHLMLEYTNRTLVIQDGIIIAEDTPDTILSSPEIVAQASLKETSLFTLAQKFQLADPAAFVKKFILQDRKERVK